VSTNTAPEDAELADVIDARNNPDVLTRSDLIGKAQGYMAEWLTNRKNRRAIPHRMGRCGYVSVHNPYREDGR
jgi:hypothetical protein